MRKTSLALGGWLLLFAATASAADRAHPFVVEGPFPNRAVGADAAVAARNALVRAAPWAGSATLVHVGTTSPAAGALRVVRFQQRHLGVPVVNRGAGVALRADGTAAFAAVKVEEDLPSSVAPGLDATRAADIATHLVGLEAKASDATLVVFPTPRGARLAWLVVPSERVLGVPYAPIVYLDATTGERLAGWNDVHTLDAAQVYESNPVSTPNPIDVTLPVESGATTLQNERVKSFNCVDHHDTKAINFSGFNLTVHTCHLDQKAIADGNGDFPYTKADDKAAEDEFSEVSMFYHANKAYDRFIGFGMTDLATKPLPTVSNLMMPQGFDTFDQTKLSDPNLPFVPFQNAFYMGANPIFGQIFGLTGGAMWFGQGPARDYSYDGDVVYHEFTHAVVEHTINFVGNYHADEQGLIDSPGAMNEGTADFFSSGITGDPLVGEYAAQDLMPGLAAIRDLTKKNSCPNDVVGEVHADSLFFSAGLWSVRSSLTDAEKQQFDQAYFDVLAAAPGGDVSYEEVVGLLVTAVKSSPLGQSVADALTTEMTSRGVLPGCKRVLEWTGKAINGTDSFSGFAFSAPGTNDAPSGSISYAPGVVQFHVKMQPATQLVAKFAKLTASTGGGGFGQGTPFAPQVLVRWGSQPITFDWSNGLDSTADVTADATASGNAYTATIDVPAEVTDAYVMVANTGQTSGLYKSVDFAFQGTPTVDAGTDAGDDASPDGGTDDAAPPDDTAAAPASDDGGGCGCRTAGDPTSSGIGWLAGLAMSAIAARRRRRPAARRS